MCFVAGTTIQTLFGDVPIEDVRAGDLVLSRDELTGEVAYKEVTQTFVTRPEALYHVEYDPDGDGPEGPETISTTAPHPFWVIDEAGTASGRWVTAADLAAGDGLLMGDGLHGEVLGLRVERAAADATFTTYNFAVADFATYFAGDGGGVWVHNAASALCGKAFSIWQRQTTHLNQSPEQAFNNVETLLTQYMTKHQFSQDQSVRHLGDVLDEAVREVRSQQGKYVPPGDIWSPGPKKVNSPAINLWARHWLKHRAEFPDLTGPFDYVDTALDFADSRVSINDLRVVEGDQFGFRQRIVWDRANGLNNFAVATIDPATGSVQKMSTFFRPDRAYLENKLGLQDIPGGKDVFEQYFDLAAAKLTNRIVR